MTTKAKQYSTILGRATLVNLVISTWDARRMDRKITDEVTARHNASRDAGRWSKHLFGGKVASHQKVLTLATTLRSIHYAQTLPWLDNGWRLLPTDNFMAYAKQIRSMKSEFEEAVTAFLREYPDLVRDAKKKLNGMFNQRDYPSRDAVARKFSFTVQYSPLPAKSDFRVDLPREVMRELERSVEDRLAEAANVAMRDVWGRLAEVVLGLSVRLNDDGKYMRESLITKVREVAESLDKMNVAQDPQLTITCERVLRDLGTLDLETLKGDEKLRADAARKANAIMKSMAGLYDAPPFEAHATSKAA